jgi:glucose/arabinose dehydrogenase
MKILVFLLAAGLAFSAEPDGLVLPPGFHASIVSEGLGPIRHLAVRPNGDLYISTPVDRQNKGDGIIAVHLDANHKADHVDHFGAVAGGTAIRFYKGALYAASASSIYRFTFDGNDALLPKGNADVIVDGMPGEHPGFARENVAMAFDDKGNLYIALPASANLCIDPNVPKGAPAKGLKPCPDLADRAGVWRFSAGKTGQKFSDGEQLATGIRDISSLDWSAADGHLYGIMHGRDNTSRMFPSIVSAEDENNIADEMHLIRKNTNFGWPYTYYDGVRKLRLIAPEYGGDGKMVVPAGAYSTPVLTFEGPRAAPVDLLFYSGKNFPAEYREGAFIVLHGTRNKSGYDVMFVPFNRQGKSGEPKVFANGFAGFDATAAKPGRAKYRPIGEAVGPDGALYVTDSQVGRIWRITYGEGL